MKTHLNRVPMIAPAVLALLLAVNSQFSTLQAQGTAFTYQGRLTDSGQCADGLYDFIFTVYNNPNPALATFNANNVNTTTAIPVTNGLFTVTNLDFGTSPFVPGQALWLQIQVRTNNTPPYGTLTPLQALTPTPYAIAAENVNGSVSASQLTGMLPSASFSGTYGNAVNLSNTGNSFTGNGAGLVDVNASTVGGLPPSNFWQLMGNAGTTPGLNFLGTTDNKALELHVNSQRAMQILVPASDSPNLIGGFNGNLVDASLNGAVIAGGGTASFESQGSTNHVSASYSSIGGGSGNWIQASSDHTVIGGGWNNLVGNSAYQSVIAGGEANSLMLHADHSAIGGGQQNTIYSEWATIGGGALNTNSANFSGIGGGEYNAIGVNLNFSTIAGGSYNLIPNNSAFIGGGATNTTAGDYSTISGGANNYTTNPFTTVGGGQLNSAASVYATVAGGHGNVAAGIGSFIGGGGYDGNLFSANLVQANAATIGGGMGNNIQSGANYAVIAGGGNNIASGNEATIGGGVGNTASGAEEPVVGGGGNNTASGQYSTVGGGSGNTAGGQGSFVGGGGYNGSAFFGNNALGNASAIAGGWGNSIQSEGNYGFIGGGYTNYVSGPYATVSGGQSCSAVGSNSAVGGGFANRAYSLYATVPGGYDNFAGGAYSFAAGNQAMANYQGDFVWADSQNLNFSSTTSDEFSIRAENGVRIQSDVGIHLDPTNGAPLIVRDWDVFAATAGYPKAGVGRWGLFQEFQHLTAGIPDNVLGYFQVAEYNTNGIATMLMQVDRSGNITNTGNIYSGGDIYSHGINLGSDRNIKENFEPLDAQVVLTKVAALPVSEWNYKSDPAGQKHLGPMAQDFHAAFGLNGQDDKHISVVDEGGVALAAIQGLNEKVEGTSQKAEGQIEQLETDNAELKRQLTDLRSQLEAMQKVIGQLGGQSEIAPQDPR